MNPTHEGIKMTLGGEERVIPPLTLRALRKLTPQLKSIATMGRELPNEEQITAIAAIVHEALKRNYPEVTIDQVEDWLDMGNLAPTLAAVMSVAGLEKRAPGAGGA